MQSPLFLLAALLVLSHVAFGCRPLGWRHWSMEEIIYNQTIVVFGKEVNRFNPEANNILQNANFQVYCVLKNDDPGKPIPENIMIEEVYPVTSCSGTDITTGTDIILGLKRKGGNFLWDEPNEVPDGAAFNATTEVLGRATRVCGLQDPVTPQGRQPTTLPKCPHVIQDIGCTTSVPGNSAKVITPCVSMLGLLAFNLFLTFLAI